MRNHNPVGLSVGVLIINATKLKEDIKFIVYLRTITRWHWLSKRLKNCYEIIKQISGSRHYRNADIQVGPAAPFLLGLYPDPARRILAATIWCRSCGYRDKGGLWVGLGLWVVGWGRAKLKHCYFIKTMMIIGVFSGNMVFFAIEKSVIGYGRSCNVIIYPPPDSFLPSVFPCFINAIMLFQAVKNWLRTIICYYLILN